MSGLFKRAAALFGAVEAKLRDRISATRGDFEPGRYVWSRGFALLCDHNGGPDFVRQQRGGRPALRFPREAFDDVREGDLVWVRLIALPQFLEEALPRIHARFTLVTGDEDWSIPGGFERVRELLESDKLLCWFTQNLDQTDAHPKLGCLPIGLDFHTIANGRKWGHEQASPTEQEAELEELRRAAPPNRERLLRVHADFHFNKHKHQVWGDARQDVEQVLRQNSLIAFQTHKVPRTELWREKTRYAFVASPHGNGLDCHRTWESLVLGNIVIVKRSSLDPLYEGLPVVILDEWDRIDEGRLREWQAELGSLFERPEVTERLTGKYWIHRMRRVTRERLDALGP